MYFSIYIFPYLTMQYDQDTTTSICTYILFVFKLSQLWLSRRVSQTLALYVAAHVTATGNTRACCWTLNALIKPTSGSHHFRFGGRTFTCCSPTVRKC